MEIVFDEKTGVPRVSIDKNEKLSMQDLDDARFIKTMLNSRGWKALKKYQEVGRESIIDAGKLGIKSRDTSELSRLKWAILKGWDENSKLAERIVARAEEYQPKEELSNDEPDEF